MRLAATELEIEVREATSVDVPLILSFVHAMAEVEKLQVAATEETLQESLFGDDPAAYALLGFVDGAPVAYVIYCFTFATMVGKRVLWLDDLYVQKEYRGRGIGRALMAYLADVALRHNCGRFEWKVLDWNQPAIDFYANLGAPILDRWGLCRLDEDGIARVAGMLRPVGE
ncbi:MAG: GNAT family N-acetyltransferase [Anaerolineae bacterium]|jgi:GNAT superfamily N-acetyltransferase